MPRSRGVAVRRVMLLAVLLAGIVCAFFARSYLTVPQIQAFVARRG